MIMLFDKLMKMRPKDVLDEEVTRIVERSAILRLLTKHVNLWILQLETKRREIAELTRLSGFEGVQKEVETDKSLERRARKINKLLHGEEESGVL